MGVMTALQFFGKTIANQTGLVEPQSLSPNRLKEVMPATRTNIPFLNFMLNFPGITKAI